MVLYRTYLQFKLHPIGDNLMKKCPNCSYSNPDVKFCAECGTDLRTVEVKKTCYIAMKSEDGVYTVRGERYPTREAFEDAHLNMMHNLDGIFVIHAFVDDLVTGQPFTPIGIDKIVNFGTFRRYDPFPITLS